MNYFQIHKYLHTLIRFNRPHTNAISTATDRKTSELARREDNLQVISISFQLFLIQSQAIAVD